MPLSPRSENSACLGQFIGCTSRRSLSISLTADLVSQFQKHGIAQAFPHYVLIDPEERVLLDDRTIPHLYLRTYKLEIIRKLLLNSKL
jgi:hypothetical protein